MNKYEACRRKLTNIIRMSRFDSLSKYQINKAFDFIFYTENMLRNNQNKNYNKLTFKITNITFNSRIQLNNFLLIIADYFYGRKFKVEMFINQNEILFDFIFKN